MTLVEKLYLLDRIHHLIRKKGTGTPTQLAQRLGISNRTVYNIINTLKDLGADIYFCSDRHSYCYADQISFRFLPIVERSLKVKGGKQFDWTIPSMSMNEIDHQECFEVGN